MHTSFWRKYGLAIASGFLYGLTLRLLFGFQPSSSVWSSVFTVMSYAFIFFMPVVIGAMTVALAPPQPALTWVAWLFMPWLPCLLMLLAALLLGWEGLICVVFAAPIMLLCASLGGLLGGLIRRYGSRRQYVFASIILLPFAVSPLESHLPQDAFRTVTTAMVINAPAAVVWQEIIRVPPIQDHERRVSFLHHIGIPRPLEATLSHEGPGGIREARFEQGILFYEEITTWQPEQALGFTIRVEPQSIPPQALDEHVRVGERYFDVLFGHFQITSYPAGGILLTLSSRHRITTPFNWYAALWSEWVMADIQETICQVIKKRSERSGAAVSGP